MNENDIAVKNKRAYANDAARIISGALISLILIVIVLIFRKSVAFVSGKYSPLDFTLLFLFLSGGLFVNGVKFLRNHRKMPEIMITNYNASFLVLGDEVPYAAIKSLNGKHEFGRTGTIILTTDSATYNLYGVKNYANAINVLSGIISENVKKPS